MAVASAIAQISITVLMSGIEVVMVELRRQSLGGEKKRAPQTLFLYFHPFSFLLNTLSDNVLLPFKPSVVNAVVWP